MLRVLDIEAEEPNQFMDECTLYRKALCGDIFVYSLLAPSCSSYCCFPLQAIQEAINTPPLHACARRPLVRKRRGDTPFCSDECRREQIEIDRVRLQRKKQ
jgi:hypothetical protein